MPLILFIAIYVLMNWTRYGRHFYAVGGNTKAAALSGINTRRTLFLAYVLVGLTCIVGAAADRPARDGRGQYRRVDAAGIDRRLRHRRRVAARRARAVENVVLGALFIGWCRTA